MIDSHSHNIHIMVFLFYSRVTYKCQFIESGSLTGFTGWLRIWQPFTQQIIPYSSITIRIIFASDTE